MRCILSLEIRIWMGRLVSSTLVVVVLNLLEVLSKLHKLPRINGLKIGIDFGLIIQFLLLKRGMNQGKL